MLRGKGRQPLNKATIECFKCHHLGHFQYECPDWDKKANYAEVEEEEELLMISYVELHQAKREEILFLDFRPNYHMTGNKEWFSNLQEYFNRAVKLRNDTRMEVTAKKKYKGANKWHNPGNI